MEVVRRKRRERSIKAVGHRSAVPWVWQRPTGEWGPDVPKAWISQPQQRLVPRKQKRRQDTKQQAWTLTMTADRLRMKGSLPCYAGIPGPCEILKGVGVGESTVNKIIFHQSLWRQLEMRINEKK